MKNINFKRIKFSTFFKNINSSSNYFYKLCKGIGFTIFYKYLNISKFYKYIDIRRYNFTKYIDIRRYNFTKYIDIRRYNFTKYIDIRRYNFSNYIDIRRYNFYGIKKFINLKKYKSIPFYFLSAVFLAAIVYLSIPIFFNYEKTKIEKLICEDIKINCTISGEISYNFLPSPRIKLKNLVIKDFTNNNRSIGKIKDVVIKLSFYNLNNKQEFNFTKIEFKNAIINFDLENFKKIKKIYSKKINSLPFEFTNGEINFFEKEKYVSKIENINFKYRYDDNSLTAVLKGIFLGDDIFISFENEKEEKNFKKTFTLKLTNLNLFTKMEMFEPFSEKNKLSGNVLLKKDKNRIAGLIEYADNKITFKHANLNSTFLDGKFTGEIKLLPYFNFDLDINLNNINLNRIYNSLIALNKEYKKNLFRINNKINGKLLLSTDNIISKKSFIESFESQIKFINGNVFIEKLLFNLGKLGAADISGTVANDKKFSNFKFESNVFIDNLKKFYSKFGVYNKPKVPYDLFISGNVDLTNLVLRINEIFTSEKLKGEDVAYFEREFNELLLKNGYTTLINYSKLKEFIQLTSPEEN